MSGLLPCRSGKLLRRPRPRRRAACGDKGPEMPGAGASDEGDLVRALVAAGAGSNGGRTRPRRRYRRCPPGSDSATGRTAVLASVKTWAEQIRARLWRDRRARLSDAPASADARSAEARHRSAGDLETGRLD